MSNHISAINTAPQALNSMYLIGNFKELFDPSLEKVKSNKSMSDLVESIWQTTQTRYKSQNDKRLAQYPALVSSIILIANHYDDLKNMNKEYLSALSYATYYLTNGLTNDLVLLFGDGILIDKIIKKLKVKDLDRSSKNYYTLNTMGNFLGYYYNNMQKQNINQIKLYLNDYIDSLDVDQLKKLKPLFELTDEDLDYVYKYLFMSSDNHDKKGATKR